MNAIIDADALAQFVGNANTLVTEAKFRFGPDELGLTAVDPANVGMVDESLDAEAFESYDAPADGAVLGLDLDRLDDVLGMADSGQLAHLTLNEETLKLRVEIGALEYTFALIDPGTIRNEPDVPDVLDNLTAKLVVEASELQRAETAADLCSDHITIGAEADVGLFYAEAEGDTDEVRVEWERADVLDGARIDEDAESIFSLGYVSDLLKPLSSGTETTVHVGTEFPMFVDSAFADGDGELRYSLAPRIQDGGGR